MIAPVLLGFATLVTEEICPAPVDVEQRVRVILHLLPEQALNEHFSVERHEAGLYVELQSAEGVTIGERTLPVDGSCDELAQAAAVVLSAWLTDVHPDFAGALPEPEPAPTVLPTASAPRPPAKPGSPATKAPSHAATPREHAPSHRVALAAALGVGTAGGKWALSGLFDAGWLPNASGVGLSARLLVDATRRGALGSGNVAWRRWPLALGPTLRLHTQRIAWELSLAPSLVWVHVAGEGFDRNFAHAGVTPGAFGQLQVSSGGRRWAALAAVAGEIFFEDSEAYAGDLRYRLPAARVTILVGARWSP